MELEYLRGVASTLPTPKAPPINKGIAVVWTDEHIAWWREVGPTKSANEWTVYFGYARPSYTNLLARKHGVTLKRGTKRAKKGSCTWSKTNGALCNKDKL